MKSAPDNSKTLRDEISALHQWLDAMFLGGGSPPCSLKLDGVPAEWSAWTFTSDANERTEPGRECQTLRWCDPASGLELRCELAMFRDYPAAEWVMHLTNTGDQDSPLVSDLLPLDADLATGETVMLRYCHGSSCDYRDFMPEDRPLDEGDGVELAPDGGRSSNGVLPFFNVQGARGGFVLAVGWSGQWVLRARRQAGQIRLQAGQQLVRLRLRPGESIRTPRILLLQYSGSDSLRGNILLRRLLLDQYLPRVDGEVATPPTASNTWFPANQGWNVTQANQVEAIAAFARNGIEAYWLDAGWFGDEECEPNWAAQAGTWTVRTDAFPDGLAPVTAAAHEAGLKVIIWFEPERVRSDSLIQRKHPEFLHEDPKPRTTPDGRPDPTNTHLFRLDDPTARAWMTELLSGHIRDTDLDVLRIDFNMDPLDYWRQNDTEDRQGMTEIRYVEGLYAMWDELRERHPGLVIDNCSSGGRRIDLETVSRSFPLWRSDTQCGTPRSHLDQCQTAGLSLFVPLHAAGLWGLDPYSARSVVTTGFCLCLDHRDLAADALRRVIAEVQELRPLWLGDFYPLTAIDVDEAHWIAWQLDRPDLGKGFAVFFRRPLATAAEMACGLRALDPEARYEVRDADAGWTRTMTGCELAALRVRIDDVPGSVLLIYRKIQP